MNENNQTRTIEITNENGEKISLSKEDFINGWLEISAELDYLIVDQYHEEMRAELGKIRDTIKDMAAAKFNELFREQGDPSQDKREVIVAIVIHNDEDVIKKEVLGVFYDKLVAMDATENFIAKFESTNNREFNLIETIYEEHGIS